MTAYLNSSQYVCAVQVLHWNSKFSLTVSLQTIRAKFPVDQIILCLSPRREAAFLNFLKMPPSFSMSQIPISVNFSSNCSPKLSINIGFID